MSRNRAPSLSARRSARLQLPGSRLMLVMRTRVCGSSRRPASYRCSPSRGGSSLARHLIADKGAIADERRSLCGDTLVVIAEGPKASGHGGVGDDGHQSLP
jgi:hypothetical protein